MQRMHIYFDHPPVRLAIWKSVRNSSKIIYQGNFSKVQVYRMISIAPPHCRFQRRFPRLRKSTAPRRIRNDPRDYFLMLFIYLTYDIIH